jgi:putative membrane protein
MSDTADPPRRARPRAFRLAPEDRGAPGSDRPVRVELQEDAYAAEAAAALVPADELAVEAAQARGMLGRFVPSWGGLFWAALSALVSLAAGLWVDRLVEDLFSRSATFGWIAAVLAGFVALALIALAVREIVGVFRQTHVAKLHAALAAAHLADDRDAARTRVKELANLYRNRPIAAGARAEIDRNVTEIIDGRDLVEIAERSLMGPLDARAAREIADAAKRVSLVTAISPRALLDVIFVVAQLIRLIRKIAELYSGRPGFFGFLRLAKSVGAHLAVTGGMAVGDSLVQQVVGHGIAAKLSARLGEGVLNGLLTTRVGLSAMAVCRPMPFAALRQPGVKDVAPFLFGPGER